MEIRTGIGYDIHELKRGRKFILGNVIIPYKKGFVAHSDGDVLIHSIIDALIGALALGDIGRLFPDTDSFYKDMDSSVLLKKVNTMVKERGFNIVNIDTVVLCEKPNLSKYIEMIIKRLSEILEIDVKKISVKAKTKEKFDSVGRSKAVEVLSTCLLIKE